MTSASALRAQTYETIAPAVAQVDTTTPDTHGSNSVYSTRYDCHADTTDPTQTAPDTITPDTTDPTQTAPDTITPDTTDPTQTAPDTITPDITGSNSDCTGHYRARYDCHTRYYGAWYWWYFPR